MVHHGAGLRKITRDSDLVEQIIKDYKKADIPKQDSTMLDYVVKLTKEPGSMVEADVQKLRNAGFSDVGILDIVQVAGYYAYVNRLADGLGVELESIWDEKKPVH
ncbi:MAG: peroxidase [SAR324 cluster bacterium]|uniref:Peroxidase n=1 Tax=SAR324 cluster bacterium TaxID=2024889 RepID=A0A432GQN0_9DELT|nr:MAG: peroxidase [SAR324 cluster bacterium]